MKKLLLLATILYSINLASSFCIPVLNIGNSCKIQDITNTNKTNIGSVTSQTTVGDTSIGGTTVGSSTLTGGDLIAPDNILIKNFNELIQQSQKANEEIIRSNSLLLDKVISEQNKRNEEWQRYLKETLARPPVFNVQNEGSPPVPFLVTGTEEKPLYIQTVAQQNTATLQALNNVADAIRNKQNFNASDLNPLISAIQSGFSGIGTSTASSTDYSNVLTITNQLLAVIASSTQSMSIPLPSGGSGESTAKSITQTAHGFVVGDWVYLNGTVYTKTDADLVASSDSVGVVTTVTDVNNFTLTTEGYATGLTGLVAGTRYYLSTTAGAITATAPTSNIKAVFIADSTTSGYVQQYAVGASSEALTYGRVNASTNLPNTGFSDVGVGSTIPFNATVYSNGMTFSGTAGIIPSVAGRYRASWLAMSGSGDLASDGTYNIVQNGVAVASVFIDQMQAAGVNQTTPFIDVDLVAGQAVTLNYQPLTSDAIPFGRGSYFQLTQLPTAVAPVVNTVPESGEAVLSASVNIPNTSTGSANATDIMSFTIPSAGTWEIPYTVRGVSNESTADQVIGMVAIITDSSNNVIPNSEIMLARHRGGATSGTANSLQVSGTGFIKVTTTGATTYKVRGFNDGSSSILTWSVSSDGNGRTKVSWNKTAGQLPSTGTTVDYINVYRTSDITVASNATIPFNTVLSGNIPYNTTTGEFTLTAGKTYSLRSNVNTFNTASALLFSWYNQTTNAIISPTGFISSADHNASWGSNQAEVIFTPTVATVVTLRNTGSISRVIPGAPFGGTLPASQATIVQLGSSNVIAGLYPGTWGTYTPTITAVTTNPTKPTSGIVVDTASYIVEGKKLTVNYNFWIGTAVGAAAGSGTYKFSLPAGYTIDTSKVSSIASFDPTLASQNIANVVGTAIINRGNQTALTSRFSGFVYAADANNVAASFITTAPSTHVMFDSASGNAGLQSGIGWTMQFTVPIN